MFTLTCNKCGAKSVISTKPKWNNGPEGLSVDGDIIFNEGREYGELYCQCTKCGNIVED